MTSGIFLIQNGQGRVHAPLFEEYWSSLSRLADSAPLFMDSRQPFGIVTPS